MVMEEFVANMLWHRFLFKVSLSLSHNNGEVFRVLGLRILKEVVFPIKYVFKGSSIRPVVTKYYGISFSVESSGEGFVLLLPSGVPDLDSNVLLTILYGFPHSIRG